MLYEFYEHNITNTIRCGNRNGLLGRNDQTHHRMLSMGFVVLCAVIREALHVLMTTERCNRKCMEME